MFSRSTWDADNLFRPVVRSALSMLPEDAPFVVAIDDTRLRKTGRKIPGVGYGRDPMSPPFHVNLVLGQRFVQLSAMVTDRHMPAPARGVPVRFRHQPPVPKPPSGANEETKKAYRARRREENLSTCGRDQIRALRQELDECHQATARRMVITGDGSYTNQTVLRGLPDRTVFIGRIRKDARLHAPPRADQQPVVGAKRQYGDVAPTPEQLRKDRSVGWSQVDAHASGKTHSFRIKEIGPVLWRKAGADLPVRIVVIAPIGYRLRKGASLLYRQPAYLLCTDLTMPIQELLQAYLWRWDIEVNHRDEKQLIGVGEGQVRSSQSVERQPILAVASYAYLLMAAMRVYGFDEKGPVIPAPKWQKNTDTPRISTQRLLQIYRSEVWKHAFERSDLNSCDFEREEDLKTKSQESTMPLAAAVIYARAG